MPLLLAVLALVLLLGLIALSLPLSILQRYRSGTARRRARQWVLSINLFGIAVSAALLLLGAVLTNPWVPRALLYTVLGLAAGCLLGLVGLAISRWEATPETLHYTPNRWLVFSITLVVAARLAYGFWRGWQAWGFTPADSSWLAAAGAAESMAAAGVVLGYYLSYWAGVRSRLKRLPQNSGS